MPGKRINQQTLEPNAIDIYTMRWDGTQMLITKDSWNPADI